MKTYLGALAAVSLGLAIAAPTIAQDNKVKIGFVTTLTGPNAAIGIDIRDGFNLGLKQLGGKFGGLTADVQIADDQFNPEIGKQAAERLVKRDRVDFLSGVVFSNIMLAVAPVAFEANTFYVSPNAAPSPLAGEKCNPFFFAASWPNDGFHEAAGQHATNKGYKNAYLLAPNYQAGKDSLSGFKRYYNGKVVDEVYTKLGQLDYSAELAQIRAAKPEALYVFLPGGMGINFYKQFVSAGLSKDMALIVPGFGSDQDIIRSVGEPMLGLFDTAHWAFDLPNDANKKFVAAYEAEYKRVPSVFVAQGYDTALMIDAAVREAKGKLADKEALRRGFKAAKFASVRGDFKMNVNGMPIQNYYLRIVSKDAQGRIVNRSMGTVFTNHGDSYAKDCKLK
ncbi:MAG: ABC transporter substrate-binding protein [Burkholderiales bacterium]